jgi:hypothetical protein
MGDVILGILVGVALCRIAKDLAEARYYHMALRLCMPPEEDDK